MCETLQICGWGAFALYAFAFIVVGAYVMSSD